MQTDQDTWRPGYDTLVAELLDQFRRLPADAPVRLAKRTSNLFRPRAQVSSPRLDVTRFDGVLHVDPQARTAEVLGMTTYEHLVDATLAHGLMPLVVPQLRTITLGGAVTGLGIESSSFRTGLPHESVLEMDILTGDGEVITVTPDPLDPNRALYFGFPNSYGSLGYALRLRIELEPITPYVELLHLRFDTADDLAAAIDRLVRSGKHDGRPVDFIDGTVFSSTEHYLTLGFKVEQVPPGLTVSDYTGMAIYYRSIQQHERDVLTAHDYLWRWDTDWFWCSRAFGAQRPTIRRLWPKHRLRSDMYWKLVAFDQRHDVSGALNRLRRRPQRESVVQDIEVPVGNLAEFLAFFHDQVGIEPIWVCPMRQRDPDARWPLYEFDSTETYVNVGFWSTVAIPDDVSRDDGIVNRRIEHKVTELNGRKSLYSTAYYGRDEFWAIYGGSEYQKLKQHYDPHGRLLGLYEKVVERR